MSSDKTGKVELILTGVEAALELERELGVRYFECDRSLLLPVSKASEPETPVRKKTVATGSYDFVFLHDRKLSPGGTEMMDKIADALCKGIVRAPVVTDAPPPPAKAYVVLGSLALKKFFPGLRGAPGQWLESDSGVKVLVSNSPEYILRFGRETEAVKKIKQDMWRSLKTVRQRLGIA